MLLLCCLLYFSISYSIRNTLYITGVLIALLTLHSCEHSSRLCDASAAFSSCLCASLLNTVF